MGAGINVMGKLEAGVAQAGEKILVMPAGEQGIIKGESQARQGSEFVVYIVIQEERLGFMTIIVLISN